MNQKTRGGPDPIDVHVGVRLRRRRREIEVSQQALAEALGVTFQQVQKYERGANRVSASMLLHAAVALGVSPGWFFEGLPQPQSQPETDAERHVRLWALGEGAELVAALAGLSAEDIEALWPIVRRLTTATLKGSPALAKVLAEVRRGGAVSVSMVKAIARDQGALVR